jgi:2-dehydro-3-deoxyphosphogluconate aldolase / (4S)-4-hydroxy-2-oxoglutarate aldolase
MPTSVAPGATWWRWSPRHDARTIVRSATTMTWLRDHLVRHRLIAILRAPSIAEPERLVAELVSVGLSTIEFTFTTHDALPLIERAAAVDGATIAAGSVTTATQAREAHDAGAHFIVSPMRDLDVEAQCHQLDIPYVPGAMTPTEIVQAVNAGAEVVKVFPARSLGPAFISDVLAPLPELGLVPTGGVDPTQVASYLRAGAIAVGTGSVAPPDLLVHGDIAAICERAARLVAAAADAELDDR